LRDEVGSSEMARGAQRISQIEGRRVFLQGRQPTYDLVMEREANGHDNRVQATAFAESTGLHYASLMFLAWESEEALRRDAYHSVAHMQRFMRLTPMLSRCFLSGKGRGRLRRPYAVCQIITRTKQALLALLSNFHFQLRHLVRQLFDLLALRLQHPTDVL